MDFGTILPPRPVEDILAERVRLLIGGEVFDLPVLTIAENRAWKERSDRELGLFIATITLTDDLSEVMERFDGVLPPREVIEEGLTPLGLFRAVCEVWRAARPLADIARTGMSTLPPTGGRGMNGWRRRTRSWLRNMAGPSARSSAN